MRKRRRKEERKRKWKSKIIIASSCVFFVSSLWVSASHLFDYLPLDRPMYVYECHVVTQLNSYRHDCITNMTGFFLTCIRMCP